MGLLSTLDHVGVVITAGGVPADADNTRLIPPCAWVTPASTEVRTAGRTPRYLLDVYLIVRDTGYADSLSELDRLLGQTLAAVHADPDMVVSGPIDLASGVEVAGAVLPAFKVTIELEEQE